MKILEYIHFKKWFHKLDNTTKISILRKTKRIIEHNDFGDYKNLGDEVYEIRIHSGAGYRIYFAKQNQEIILLLVGGTKRNQQDDIKKAKEIWRQIKNEN